MIFITYSYTHLPGDSGAQAFCPLHFVTSLATRLTVTIVIIIGTEHIRITFEAMYLKGIAWSL